MNTTATDQPPATADAVLDSAYSWRRLAVSLSISTIGGLGLWSVVVVLPAIEAEFGIDRGSASLPYFTTMIGAAVGGVFMGRLADRFGISRPLALGAVMLCVGYCLAALSTNLWQFMAVQALFVGMLGTSVSFGPLVADVSLWFRRRRGIAVAIVASGNYLAGTIWPPLLQYAIDSWGWRMTHVGMGVFCLVTLLPLSLALLRRFDMDDAGTLSHSLIRPVSTLLSSRANQVLLMIAGVGCCIAMAMPQVHIVPYCGDLGYGTAIGAQMLSIMLGLGVVSRIASGVIADRIGGLATLLLGSMLQCLALALYLPFDGLMSLYVVSALFGLAQGGIVPSYALVVRDLFPAREAGTRISLVMMSTVFGMAAGGWLSGEIYDWTGSYQAAFLHGIAWNLLNMSIAVFLLVGRRRARPALT